LRPNGSLFCSTCFAQTRRGSSGSWQCAPWIHEAQTPRDAADCPRPVPLRRATSCPVEGRREGTSGGQSGHRSLTQPAFRGMTSHALLAHARLPRCPCTGSSSAGACSTAFHPNDACTGPACAGDCRCPTRPHNPCCAIQLTMPCYSTLLSRHNRRCLEICSAAAVAASRPTAASLAVHRHRNYHSPLSTAVCCPLATCTVR